MFLQRFRGEPAVSLEDQFSESLVPLVPRAIQGGQSVLVRVTHCIGLPGEDEDLQFFPGDDRTDDRENRGSQDCQGPFYEWLAIHDGVFFRMREALDPGLGDASSTIPVQWPAD